MSASSCIDGRSRPALLRLYQYATCPHCRRVLRRARELGIELETVDARQPEHRKHLIEVGGKRQVPCLFVNGEPMYESADIIAFLEAMSRAD